MASAGGMLFFAASDGVHGFELWKSDGTAVGTVMVKDIVPGSGSASPICPASVGSVLYFRVNDGTHGDELWKTDGTEGGTTLVRDINPGAPGSKSCEGGVGAALGGVLYFSADDGVHGEELWKTDGTEGETTLVRDINPGSASAEPFSHVPWEGALYFNAIHPSYGLELWKTDGTGPGTLLVRDIWPGPGSSESSSLSPGSTALFFFATDQTMRFELWRTDGTDGTDVGTVKVSTAVQRALGATATAMLNGVLLFPGDDGVHGVELWRSDGAAAGTWLVRDIWASGDGYPSGLRVAGGQLYFAAADGIVGLELWRSDGRAEGTRLVADLNTAGDSTPGRLTASGDRLYFTADDGGGRGLWVLDLFLPAADADFYAVTPCRLVDTRSPEGPSGGPALGANTVRTFPVSGGACDVPSTAVAVSVNLVAVQPAAAGHLTLFPGDASGPPLVSNVNFSSGRTRANNAVVPLATNGSGTINVKNGSPGAVHFVLDVNGYFQ